MMKWWWWWRWSQWCTYWFIKLWSPSLSALGSPSMLEASVSGNWVMSKYLWKTIHYTMGTESILRLELKSRISALIATPAKAVGRGMFQVPLKRPGLERVLPKHCSTSSSKVSASWKITWKWSWIGWHLGLRKGVCFGLKSQTCPTWPLFCSGQQVLESALALWLCCAAIWPKPYLLTRLTSKAHSAKASIDGNAKKTCMQ